jgi:4-carboxymuconolactone decarboxylase
MDRIERSKQKCAELFGNTDFPAFGTDPDFVDILNRFIFGDMIRQRQQNTPENQKHIQEYLSAFCFGEIYSRSGLDIKTRELLTLCILSALGGCESQLKSHVQGNLNVGNDKELMIEAITQCMPYMGFPRTLNALNCVNDKS